jgi:hypothetical protein
LIGDSGHHRQSQIRAGGASSRIPSPERRLRGSLCRNLATSPLPGCCTSVTGIRCFGRCHRGPRVPVLAEAGAWRASGARRPRPAQTTGPSPAARISKRRDSTATSGDKSAISRYERDCTAGLSRGRLVGAGRRRLQNNRRRQAPRGQPASSPYIHSRATRQEAEARRIRLAGADLEVQYES